MSESHDAKPLAITDSYQEFIESDKYVAIVIRQHMRPDDDGPHPVIFPPTYPMTTLKGRVHTIRDGEYRVSVELPGDTKGKSDSADNQKAGYNIDFFPGDRNVCEIDSPQSQANRVEPRLKEYVPSVKVQVGNDPVFSKNVDLLEAGHRAADAVIRMSSLAAEFHEAFKRAKHDDYFPLATLAPTSLVFGVWDSRSTYVKVQRIFRAYIRATDVQLRTRSAQFTPAVDYISAGALDEDANKPEGARGSETTSMSSEGMKHALATQTAGGVLLTERSTLMRTVVINLAAVRDLKSSDDAHRKALQKYILYLALTAAIEDPDTKLREGCNLRLRDETDPVVAIPRRGKDEPIGLDPVAIRRATETARDEFFKLAEADFKPTENKKTFTRDYQATFESGVAEKFLQMSKNDRAAICQLGPVTETTFKLYDAKKSNPFSTVLVRLKEMGDKKTLGARPKANAPKVVNVEAFKQVSEALHLMTTDPLLKEYVKGKAGELIELVANHTDAHATHKAIGDQIKEFNKSLKSEGQKTQEDAL
jgi:CRISPR-associated protein Csb1